MISARLIKDLEARGFSLEFPAYASLESEIAEVIKEDNARLSLALPLLLQEEFSYDKIIKLLSKPKEAALLKKAVLITNKILVSEGKENAHLALIIRKNRIRGKIDGPEFRQYYDAYRSAASQALKEGMESFSKDIKLRTTLDTNKALSAIFSPGKLRIMEKIFDHSKLSNTELKYYYRSIRPLIHAIVHAEMQKYVRIIETVRKEHE